MEKEIWKDIPNYEGFYQASNYGRIRSLDCLVRCRNNHFRKKQGKILHPTPYKNGYLSVCISKDGRIKRTSVHRLVAKAFIPNPLNKPCIDHINANITDNNVNNLRWVTVKENNQNPIFKKRTSLSKKGEKCSFYGKIFNNRPIVSVDHEGNMTKYISIMEASKKGFNYRGIQHCLSGLQKQHKNHRWFYLEDFKDNPPIQ